MYGFLLRIEREGFWETNDAPRTYRDINVVAHKNGNMDAIRNKLPFRNLVTKLIKNTPVQKMYIEKRIHFVLISQTI
jgi:hypothetical protein